MAFDTTANRKRPQNFEALKGQDFVVSTLKSSIESGRIAHAYLFSGPRGVGKTTSARLLAKALCCKNGPTANPCGECEMCKSIASSSAVDVIEIDGASNTGVDDIRTIKEELMFPPQYSRYKIYIIDEVHMLSTSAFNALLKTIEEPPEWAVFIFATTELQKVPSTIQSRCQCFNFRLFGEETISSLIKKAADEDNIRIDDNSVLWISKRARGSMRDAYTLFDQCASFANGDITFEKIKSELGITGPDELLELFSYAINGEVDKAILKLNTLFKAGKSPEAFVTDAANYLRDALLIVSGIEEKTLLFSPVEYFDKQLLLSVGKAGLEKALERFLRLYREIRYSIAPIYEIECALSSFSTLKYSLTNEQIVMQLEGLKKALLEGLNKADQNLTFSITDTQENNRAQNIEQREAVSVSENLLDAHTPVENSEKNTDSTDKQIADIIKKSSMILYSAFLSKAFLEKKDEGYVLGITSVLGYTECQKPESLKLITNAVNSVYGTSLPLKIEKVQSAKKEREYTKADEIAKMFKGDVV